MKGKSTKSNSTYFIALRKRLDALGYGDLPLGLDSAPLAQQMMEDIFATTESLKDSEEKLEKEKSNAMLLEAQLEPLQAELTRLTRENTQLHQLLIKSKEDLVKQDNQFSMSSFELNAENRRMKLLNQKTNEQVVNLQKQLEIANAKLKEALESPSVTNISELSDREGSRRTKRSARSRRTGSGSISIDGQSTLSSPDAEELKALKEEIANLKATIESKDKEISIYNTKLTEANNIIKIKDEEIIRIGAELEKETGRNGYIITLRHKFAQQELELEKLRAQLRVAGSARSSVIRPHRFVRTNPKRIFSTDMNNNEDMKFSSAVTSSAQSTPSKSDKSSKNNDSSSMISDEYDSNFAPEKAKPRKTAQQKQPQQQSQQNNQQQKKTVNIETKQQAQQNLINSQLEESQETIKKLEQDINNLNEQIKFITAEKEQHLAKIAELTANIAFIGDNFKSTVQEKDQVIQTLSNEKSKLEEKLQETIATLTKQKEEEKAQAQLDISKPLEQLAKQLEDTRAEFTARIKVKKQKITELRGRIAELQKPKELPPCKKCPVLKAKIEELTKEIESIKKDNSDYNALQDHIKQLENLLHAADEEKDLHSNDAQKLAESIVRVGALEGELEETKSKLNSALREVERMKARVEESERLSATVPDIQQKCRVSMEQAKAENEALQEEIKCKSEFIAELNSRYVECQKLNRKYQQQCQKALDEAQTMRDEAKFHRTKNEEVQMIATEKLATLKSESTATINQLRREVQQKTQEIEGLNKVLARTRADLAPLTEVQIPQLNEQVAKLKRERQELAIRIKSLCELAQFAEKTTEFSPNSIAFVQALHHFNDEVRPFL